MEIIPLKSNWRRNWKKWLLIVSVAIILNWISKEALIGIALAIIFNYGLSMDEEEVNNNYEKYKMAIWIAKKVESEGIKYIDNIQNDGFIRAVLTYSEEVYFKYENDNVPFCLRETAKNVFNKIRRDSTVEEVNSYFSHCIQDVYALRANAEFKSLNENQSQALIHATISHIEHIRLMLIQVIDKKITSELSFVKCQWLVQWLIEMNERCFSYPDFVRPFNLIQSSIVHLMLPDYSNLYSFEEELSSLKDKLEDFVSSTVYEAESDVEMYLEKKVVPKKR